MKRLITILPILSLLLVGCHPEPFADAIITPNPAYVGEDITFTNLSTNTDYSEWEMGDGATSNAFNVIHHYLDPAVYNVNLRSFGRKGGVNTASYMVEVIGAELKVIVQLWTPENEPEGYLLEGASVRLYPTQLDWELETNMVDEQFTDSNGECIFEDLSYQRYYVDVWEQYHDNYTLASEDVAWIETQVLEGAYYQTFVAYVDYYPDGKKSASAVRPETREVRAPEGTDRSERELKNNKISKPRK